MVELKSIKLHNFLSFEDEKFEFNQGKYLILGRNKDSEIAQSNGSGKSSLFDAIIFAIYGKADRNYQRFGTNDTYVELEFVYDNSLYLIKRYYNHYSEKNKIEIYKDGELLSFHTKKQTQDYIEKIFRLSYENFISSVAYKQGLNVKISTLTPSKRKEYFSRLVDADFDSIEKAVKTDLKVKEAELVEQRDKVAKLEKNLAYLEGQMKSLMSFVDIDDKDILDKKKQLENNIAKYEELLRLHKEELEGLKKDKEQKHSEFVSRQAKVKMELNQLKKLSSGVCPLCKQEIENIDWIKNRINQLEKVLKQKFIYIKDFKIREIEQEINRLNNDIDSYKRELYSIIEKYNKNKQAKEKIEELKVKIDDLKQELNKEQDKLIELEIDYNKLKDFHKLIKPSGELRTILLVNYLDVYNHILQNIVSSIFPEVKNIKLSIDDKMQGLIIEGINYENLSGGEKRRLDFAFQLAFSDFISMINNFDINIIVMDEVADGLDEKSLFNILNYLQDFFDGKCVYFVSHNENLKSFFSDIIYIEKENGVSRIIEF